MLTKNTISKFSSLLLGLSIALAACKPEAKVSAGITVVKVIPNNGCVAGLWATRMSSERIQKLAEKHINGEVVPSHISTDLMIAVVQGKENIVAALLDEKVNVDETNERGCTALIWASALGQEKVVFDLIIAGADASLPDGNGKTPLMFAARSGNSKIVQELIKSTASVNAAQTGGDNEIGRTPLHHAVTRKNNADILRILIDNRADVNAIDENGKTPLMVASFYGELEAVKLLVEAGADVRQKSNSGKTALDTAISWKHNEIAEYLKSID